MLCNADLRSAWRAVVKDSFMTQGCATKVTTSKLRSDLFSRYFRRMAESERAVLAHQLIASLDDVVDPGAETEWHEIIDRRSREIAEGKVNCRPVEQVVGDIRTKLHARSKPF